MYQINFNKPVKIHFMGIGGISMSGLAEILHAKGFTVVGSDAHESAITDHLESLGIQITYGQRAENITPDIDVVVYTAAIHPDNPEFAAAKAAGIPMMDRADLLGQIMTNYANAIAVSGTHGKTTTTSMLSHILLAADTDPTISVGGILKAIHGNIRVGHSDNFITEACEYTNSFLKFNPSLEIILNIEEDHLDFFKDINDIRHSFRKFAEKLDEKGILIINGEINNVTEITEGLPCHIITYGLKPACDYTAENIAFDEFAKGSFDLIAYGEKIDHIQLNVAGIHNVSNALAAIAAARELHIPMDIIKKGLMAFEGTDRRFEYKGQFNGVTVIDDYAHHPTEPLRHEVSVARSGVSSAAYYTHAKAFFHEFADALSLADKIVLAYMLPVKLIRDIHSKDIQKLLLEKGKEAYYFPSFEEIEKFLREKCINGDLLITMGAGDVVLVGEALIK
ncbi:MAG: UDP-N-acetylmuramate--L-alanine ligase [Coprococcus sp.]